MKAKLDFADDRAASTSRARRHRRCFPRRSMSTCRRLLIGLLVASSCKRATQQRESDATRLDGGRSPCMWRSESSMSGSTPSFIGQQLRRIRKEGSRCARSKHNHSANKQPTNDESNEKNRLPRKLVHTPENYRKRTSIFLTCFD